MLPLPHIPPRHGRARSRRAEVGAALVTGSGPLSPGCAASPERAGSETGLKNAKMEIPAEK